jgi:hypothetical protein
VHSAPGHSARSQLARLALTSGEGSYSPECVEGEFSEVQIRYSAYPYDDGEQIPLFGTIRTSARPQHVVVVDKYPVISSEQDKGASKEVEASGPYTIKYAYT